MLLIGIPNFITDNLVNTKQFRNFLFFSELFYIYLSEILWYFFHRGDNMTMNGEHLETLQDLKRCFCIDELLYDYISGELEIWLRRIGETDKAEKVEKIAKVNAYILLRLYEILDLNPDLSDEEIRSFSTHQK